MSSPQQVPPISVPLKPASDSRTEQGASDAARQPADDSGPVTSRTNQGESRSTKRTIGLSVAIAAILGGAAHFLYQHGSSSLGYLSQQIPQVSELEELKELRVSNETLSEELASARKETNDVVKAALESIEQKLSAKEDHVAGLERQVADLTEKSIEQTSQVTSLTHANQRLIAELDRAQDDFRKAEMPPDLAPSTPKSNPIQPPAAIQPTGKMARTASEHGGIFLSVRMLEFRRSG